MKNSLLKILLSIILGFWLTQIQAQENVTIAAPTVEAADGLDLNAVAELFKDSPNLEEFEKALNDPEQGVNNLDLDENGEVDFIRVVEEVSGETHVIILQALLGENEVQDVATIEVEKSNDDYSMQISGDELIYGPHYFIVPKAVRLSGWVIIRHIYRPRYHPYVSMFRFGYYPKWRRSFRPVAHKIYRTHTVKYVNRNGFMVTKTRKVKVVKVNHKRRSSTVVRTRTVKTKKGDKRVKTTKVIRKKRN